MNYRKICIAAFVAIAGGIVNVWGQELTLKDCSLDATPERLQPIVSEQSGDTYLMLSGDGKRVERYDYKTGKMLGVVMDSDKLRDCAVSSWDGYILSPNEKLLLLYTNVEKIYRNSFRASYYVYDIARNNIKPLSENGAQECPTFSPDGRMIAFVRDNNITEIQFWIFIFIK